VIAVSDFVVTLEKFHDAQRLADGTETVSLRTLEDQAAKGQLPGARKIGNKWWINLLAWQVDASALIAGEKTVAQSTDGQKADAAPQSQGSGRGREAKDSGRAALPRPKAQSRPGRIRFGS
jgi:hypothetical protein